MAFLIFGAGAMGSIALRDLIETYEGNKEIIVADYYTKKAEDLINSFKTNKKIKVEFCDVRNLDNFIDHFRNVEIIINCLQYQYNLDIMKFALKIKAHYIDLGGLFHFTNKQLELNEEFKKNNLIAIIGMGASPGITNILANKSYEYFDTIREIHIRLGSKDKTKYSFKQVLPLSYSLKTILEEFSYKPAIFTKGRLKFLKPMSGIKEHNFPKPVGKVKPMYTIHSEIATLPYNFKDKGIKEVSFKIAFPEDFVNKVKFLRDLGLADEKEIDINGIKIAPIDVVNKVAMSQPIPKVIGKINQCEIIRVIAKGIKYNKKMTLILDCFTYSKPEWNVGSDINTGSPPSIVAQMIDKKLIKEIGVHPPEKVIPFELFIKEIEKRNMILKIEERKSWRFKD
jgi:saccharopine dehydrogenase (NAD+, L-lysine-forming)